MDMSKWLTLDVECYPNYLLIMFRKVTSGQVIYFEKFQDSELNILNIKKILKSYTIVSFNGNKYDALITEAAMARFNNETLYKMTVAVIEEKEPLWKVRAKYGVAAFDFDHIDIIEVCPLQANLKIYGGRIHSPKLRDLPIAPGSIIKESQIADLRTYCINDNEVTSLIANTIIKEIELRAAMSEEYGVDLRSKSDAQIAEAVIKNELEDKHNLIAKKPSIKAGTVYKYKAPSNIAFETEIMQDVLRQYTSLPFTVDSSGYLSFNFEMNESDRIKSGKKKGEMPKSKPQLKIKIGTTDYKIGIGGLHSCEKSIRHTNEKHILRDYDVASFYPRIILNNSYYPQHLGRAFLDIYNSIVERRLKAKKEGNKVVNESLKITINGSFGKLGSKWSCLYSPDLMMQVTVTGQLTLLMLIERLELAGIKVVSANTDGIVVKLERNQEKLCQQITEDWQFDTDYELESTDYSSLNSRDINNYIAVKADGKGCKGKGAYADQRDHYYQLRSNPTNDICTEAVKLFLQDGTCYKKTVKSCKDITKFLTLRTVNGGAVKGDQWLGKAIRWYYGANELDAIYYSTNGNKVPRSDGAVPLMDLPKSFPDDVDWNWYISECEKILKEIGCEKLI